MNRIGIDVGGTNTDAVLLEDDRVRHAVKTPTTADVMAGLRAYHGIVNKWLLVVYAILAVWGIYYLFTYWGGLGPGLAR